MLIAGGGVAGLSAAYHLLEPGGFQEFLLLEARHQVGGTSRSLRTEDGFVFDHGSHALYTKSEYVAGLYHEILAGEVLHVERDAWIYSKGRFTQYPFQAKLYGLPPGVIADCILAYIRAPREQARRAAHFAEWMQAAFGDGLVRHFMGPFNEKHWKYPLDQMSHRWLSPYVTQPSLREILRGAIWPDHRKYGLNAAFWYPAMGGVGRVPEGLLRMLGEHRSQVWTDAPIRKIDLRRRKATLQDGGTISYERMVYTLPLRALLELLAGDIPLAGC